jgi:type IX secretion system PorP/SprF family membrane protein
MKMRRPILISLLLVMAGAHEVSAQFIPNSSQTFQLAPAFNPAFTGVEGYTSIKLGYRSQWASFPGAPRFLNLVVAGRINHPADVTQNALRTGTTTTQDEIPKPKRMVHGLGMTLIHNSNGDQGIIENLESGLNYAIHYPLNGGYFISLGLSLNYGSIRVRWDKLMLSDPDQFITNAQGSSFSNLNARAGILLYSPRFYIHAAYLQLYTKTETGPFTEIGYRYKASGGAGIRFPLSAAMEMRPSLMAIMDQYDNIDIDYSLKFYYEDKAWGGFSYRDNGFAALILGFEFNSLLGLSYSYEISTGGLQGFNNGSNEVIFGLKLANLRKQTPYTW